MSGPPSRLRRAVRAIAVDAGLVRRRRDFGLLVGGQFVSLAVGLLGVAEFVPILVLALVGGALADAFDRRRLVALSEALHGAAATG